MQPVVVFPFVLFCQTEKHMSWCSVAASLSGVRSYLKLQCFLGLVWGWQLSLIENRGERLLFLGLPGK